MTPTRSWVSTLRLALLTAGLLLAGVACTSSKSCAGKNCPPPQLPKFTVHLTIDGKPAPTPNGTRRIPINIGRLVRLAVWIDRAGAVDIQDVYLVVNSYPSGIDRATPSGRVKVLAHHSGSLSVGDSVQATWTPTPLFGTDKLDVTVDFTIAGSGVGWTAANLQLAP